MSNTTVSARTSTTDVALEALRRRQEEERAAARERARLAEEARHREEALRRRAQAATRTIADQELRYQREVTRLDEAAKRLPDLTKRAPKLAALSNEVSADVDKLERHAANVTSAVDRFAHELTRAIEEAERLLRRRIATAAAWLKADEFEKRINQRKQAAHDLAKQMGDPASFKKSATRPNDGAELEEVQAYVAALSAVFDEAVSVHAQLSARWETRVRARAMGGDKVAGKAAAEALERHEAERRAQARAALQAVYKRELAAAGVSPDEMAHDVQFLIDDAVSRAVEQDHSTRVIRLVAQEKERRDGIRQALKVIQETPDFAHEDHSLSRRWQSAVAKAQRVLAGQDHFTAGLEHEIAQIRKDAQRHINLAYDRAHWERAMTAQGFEVFERDDGKGLIVIDLNHPEVWLEGTDRSTERAFVMELELKTDAEMPVVRQSAVTGDICEKLAKTSGGAALDVVTDSDVLERKDHIARARRPTAKKALGLQL